MFPENDEKTVFLLNSYYSKDFQAPRKFAKTKSKLFWLITTFVISVLLLISNQLGTPEPSDKAPEGLISFDSIVLHDKEQGRNQTKLPVTHAFINSVYFYPTSKSLGDNAIGMVMAIDQRSHEIDRAVFNLIGTNATMQINSTAISQTEGVITCRYTTLMAAGTTVANLTTLELESNGVRVEVPFKMARYTAPKPVIICISPQFVAEQWQMFVMHVHVANRFGGHLHMYVTSMIESYFELMKEYERQGYMTLDFWLRMKFSESQTPYFEPNENVEWRNQAGAETDCLLQYKEAAEYIAFFDMDDILFPKSYPTYLEEFNAEWIFSPDSNSMFYGRREHEFIKAETLSEFNFHELVGSLKSSPLVKRGKVVVKPERYNSTWIHYSIHDAKRRTIEHPSLVHVQRPLQKHSKTNNNMTSIWKMEFGPLNETIRDEDVRAIEEDIQRMRNLSVITDIADKLPNADFYLPIVFKCYYDAFYGPAFDKQKTGYGCPNADSCELPQRDDFKCVHSDAEYFSGPHMEPVTFHFTKRSRWNWDIGCYQ